MWRLWSDLLPELSEIVDDVAVTLGIKAPHDSSHQSLDPLLAAIGYSVVGCFFGVLSLLVWRASILHDRLALAGLIASPVLTGIVMQGIGLALRMTGRVGRATTFTSFWGGAGLAFGFAAIRFMIAL